MARLASLGAGGAQSHFNDLCDLLGVPKPTPAGRGDYTFEKATRKIGDSYVDRLLAAYDGCVPREAALVACWFAKAWERRRDGRLTRAGLVATNSIRGGADRRVLDRIVRESAIFGAWDDEKWVLDGAGCVYRWSVSVPVVKKRDPNFNPGSRRKVAGLTSIKADGRHIGSFPRRIGRLSPGHCERVMR